MNDSMGLKAGVRGLLTAWVISGLVHGTFIQTFED